MRGSNQQKEIFVYTHGPRQAEPVFMGVLSVSEVRGKEVFSFEYDSDYLNLDGAFEMDPHLRLYKGPQYLPSEQSNFGISLDSSPDRWGQVLMERREAVKAKSGKRSTKRLMESDYLLSVNWRKIVASKCQSPRHPFIPQI